MNQQLKAQAMTIPANEARSYILKQGQTIKVIDEAGQQVADFVAYNANNHKERLDPSVTMDVLRSMNIKPQDRLYSNLYTPMLTILEDTVGKHDFINSSCRPEMYDFLYQKPDHASCYHNLNHTLIQHGVSPPDQHYAFNIFMNTTIDERGLIQVKTPLSKAGDYITLKAEMDVIVAISACPCEESDCNGHLCTPISVEIN
jgi:uncharacterized protein